MADTKITSLQPPQVGYPVVPATDVLPIVVIADPGMATSGSTRKVTVNQLLGAGGTATLASATITGDLTVDTSTLYVSSSTDKVGIGTTSLSGEKLTVAGNISANAWLGRGNIAVPSGDCSIFRSADNTLGFGIASTTAMTLNSTGLGVGVSPLGKLHIRQSGAGIQEVGYFENNQAAAADVGARVSILGTGSVAMATVESAWNGAASTDAYLSFRTRGSGSVVERLRIDSSGNVGIGVTPSAWGSNFKVVQVGQAGSVYGSAPTGFYGSKFNLYNDNTNDISITNNFVGEYRFNILNGSHIWFNKSTSSGGVGVAQTLTQAMTLDASGNLLVGTTTNTNGSRVFARGTGGLTTLAIQSSTGDTANPGLLVGKFDNDSTTSQILVRFTVNNNSAGSGQINANGASQAAFGTFSDSRLKENILSLPSQLSNILSLRPVEFNYKDGSGHQIGFVAQEMQEVYSDAVGEQNGFLTVTGWSKTEARLVSAIKELAAKVQALEAKLA